MSRRLRAGLSGLALVAAACGAGAPAGPPELRLGVDECSHCRMIVSELGSAAVARGPEGEEARFDDLACLAAFARARSNVGWQIWVHAGDEPGWRDVAAVRFVHDPRRLTPMGSGWTAVASVASTAPGEVTWSELIKQPERTTDDDR